VYTAIQRFVVPLVGYSVPYPVLYQLSEVVLIPSAASSFILMSALTNTQETRRRRRVLYAVATGGAALTLVIGLHARANDSAVHLHSGWAVIAYQCSPLVAAIAVTLNDVLLFWFSIAAAVNCIRELRARPRGRTLAICLLISVISVGALAQTAAITVGTALAATGQHNSFIDGLSVIDHVSPPVFTYLGAFVAGVPLIVRLQQLLRLDRYSRLRQRLLPMWADLTQVCPEMVYPANIDKLVDHPRFRLHRTVVEIRDCLLVLSHESTQRDQQHDRLCLAVRHVLSADQTDSGTPTTGQAGRRGWRDDLLHEAEDLIRLADRWPLAKALASDWLIHQPGSHRRAATVAD
jgi:hypothetical protein